MIDNKKVIGVVCMANFCRSPVAAALLKKKLNNSFYIYSAGIKPLISAGMDPRSLKFLKKNKVFPEIHTPKEISKVLFNKSDLVFAMDQEVLINLNKKFKRDNRKIKIINFQNQKINISDPYRSSEDEYNVIMEKIKILVEELKLEEFI